MFEAREIVEKNLKDGRDYMYVGGRRYRPGDCLLRNGQEITINKIDDQTHFTDQRGSMLHSYMFYEQKWEHCPERNADKKTQERTYSAIIADKVSLEREGFRNDMVKNYSYQVYDSYERIYFWEKMSWHLMGKEREPNNKENEALIKRNNYLIACDVGLIADMYRHFLLKGANIGSKLDRERFVTGYVGEQQQLS